MQTHINCPACRTPYSADIHQIVDVGRQPELKRALIGGMLNLAQCPSCQSLTQVATPLLYHDPENELFMVFVPMELNLPLSEREQLIGQMVKRTIDSLPPEERRGYMLQPQTIMSMETIMEKVLETEGITPEMLARQRSQSELLQLLLAADQTATNELLESRSDEVDETLFAMIRSALESAEQVKQEDQVLGLLNLQAKLYGETEVGRKLERQQHAMNNFSREVRKAGSISSKLLLKHVLANREDARLVEALVVAGQQAFNYDFFLQLSDRIDKRLKSHINSDELVALRERLLALQEDMEKRSREVLEVAQNTLAEIVQAVDREAAIRERLPQIDDTFMYVLSANISQAQSRDDKVRAEVFQEVQGRIMSIIEEQAPPEIRFVNQLMQLDGDDARRKLLDDNSHMLTRELMDMVKALGDQVTSQGNEELADQIQKIEAMIVARFPA